MAVTKPFLLIFVYLSLRITSTHSAFEWGQVNVRRGFVINANETENVWPWHVAVYNSTKQYIAGGTIVSERHILTAAHVTYRHGNQELRPHELSVTMGIHDLKEPQKHTRYGTVAKIIRYPLYDDNTMVNDLALLQLSENIEFSEYIVPIGLWPTDGPSLKDLQDEPGTVVGWGLTEHSVASHVLREAKMTFIEYAKCAENTKSFMPLLSEGKNYCARGSKEQTVCRGDSGGGMYFWLEETGRWYLRGIVNQGTPTQDTRYPCDPKKDVIFMDVPFYRKWVERYALPKQHNLLGLSECGLGVYEKPTPGVDAVLKSPWIAHLYYLFWDRFFVSNCHGLLIHPEFVVTLARCVVDHPYQKLHRVVLGGYQIGPDPYGEYDIDEQKLEFTGRYQHPSFSEHSYGNDIGLIRLKQKADISRATIKPICLPAMQESVPFYTQVAWYRRTDHPKKLRSDLLQPVRFDSCKSMYSSLGIDVGPKDNLTCYQPCELSDETLTNGTQTCNLSYKKRCQIPLSGGPVLYTTSDGYNTYTYLAAMRAFGTADCSDQTNDMYTDVLALGEWIAKTVTDYAVFN